MTTAPHDNPPERSPAAGEPAPSRAGVAVRLAWTMLLVYVLSMCLYVAWRAERSTDFRDFWENALALRSTGEIRSDLGVHNYLPAFTILMTPWSLMPLNVAIVGFTILSFASLAASVVLLRECLSGIGRAGAERVLLVTSLLIAPFVHSTLTLGALNSVLLLLIVATWAALQRRREWLAGGLLGLAIVIKLLPVLLLGYLLLTRRMRAVAGALAVSLLLGLGLPLATLGWGATLEAHRQFYREGVAKHSFRATILAEKPIKANYSNVALPITLRRLLSPVNAAKGETEWRVNVADLPRPVILAIYLLIAAFFAGTTLLATGMAAGGIGARPPFVGFTDSAGLRADLALFGAWCALMLLASPLVWTHYLMLCAPGVAALLLPGAAECPRCLGRKLALPVWLLAALLLAWPQARASGMPLLGVGLLWWGCLRSAGGRLLGRQSG